MSRKILGIDIRHDAVSAVLLSSSMRDHQVEEFKHIPLARDATAPDRRAALADIRHHMGAEEAACVTSFPPDAVSYRNIEVPFRGEKRISKVLPFELESMVPFSVEDLVIDFHALTLSESEGSTPLLTASTEKPALIAYLDTLKSEGIDPESVKIGGYPAAALSVPDMDEGVFLDVGNSRSSVFIISAGQILFARTFSLTLASGEPGTARLCRNVLQTLMAFEENFSQDFSPAELRITGFGLRLLGDGHEREMADRLNLRVSRLDLVRSTPHVSIRNELRASWQPCDMDNALALALAESQGKNGLNFRKGEFSKQKKWANWRSSLIRIGIFSGILLTLLFLNAFISTWRLEKKLAVLDTRIRDVFHAALPDVRRVVDPVHQLQIAIEETRKKTLLEGDISDIRAIDLLRIMSEQISEKTDVRLTRLVITPGSITISGDTDTFNSVNEVQTQLGTASVLKKVTIVSTENDPKTKRIRFKLKVDLREKQNRNQVKTTP
ncbi:hypothetical protein DENIS_5062 [Desulfonema ishimotonii]|uniref:GspL periplasmic domain-containing protein n=1 Tax=Desulfonema ishimotonii TaxID=45657 RepID=A0A401G4E1_9BACT|nr:pilus assembly protein PilM [Desulfonema ishimotonii]GBC64061.1 hypothetical protein DENIS_5062 [Desulfonema ishimotonii]